MIRSSATPCAATSAEMAVRLLGIGWSVDMSEAARNIKCPVLVMHPERDAVVPIDEGRLRLDQLLLCGPRLEPLGPVDLGELLLDPRARGPLHLEGVAAQGAGVEVGLGGPAMDDLVALADRAQV